MKYLLILLLAAVALGAYTPKTGLDLAYFSKIAYDPLANINAWNCGSCSRFKMSDVTLHLLRLKHSSTTLGTCKAMWDTVPRTLLSLWRSGALQMPKTGSTILMPPTPLTASAQAAVFTKASTKDT